MILIYQRILSRYRIAFYEKVCDTHDIRLLHAHNNSGIAQLKDFPYSKLTRVIKLGKKETFTFICGLTDIFDKKCKIVIYEFAVGIISLPIALILAKMTKKKFGLWSHGYDRKVGFKPENSFLDRYRILIMKMADVIYVYGQNDAKLLQKYVDPQKIFVIQNTLDIPKLSKIKNDLEKETVVKVKERLNFNSTLNITYIGRLLKNKRAHHLINIAEELRKAQIDDFCIHIVGEGPLLPFMHGEVKAKGLDKYFVFHGAIYDDKTSGEILFASDFMILPSSVGLSIVHSFAFDCPIITYVESDKVKHGPEIEYLLNGKNGHKVSYKDWQSIVGIIRSYLDNRKPKSLYVENIKYIINNVASLNNMVSGFNDGIEFLEKN